MEIIKKVLAILLGAAYALYLSLAVSFSGSPDSLIEWVIWWAQIVVVTASILAVCVYVFKGSDTHKILKVLIVAPVIIFVIYYFIATGITLPIDTHPPVTSSTYGLHEPVPVQ